MRKTILTIVMVLMTAFAVQEVQAAPAKPVKQAVELKSDSMAAATAQRVEKMREKINDALDDTIVSGSMGDMGFSSGDMELTPEDMKEMSAQWADVAKFSCFASIAGLLGLVLLVLLFRFLNRRNKYRVIEKAIENNYPLNDLSLTDAKHSAIYVQQPVVTAAPPMAAMPPMPSTPSMPPMASTPQSDQVTVGTPLPGATPGNPIIMTNMVNWRAMTPALRWLGWGALSFFCGLAIDGSNPLTPVGLALIFVGLCKGFILYKEQKALQDAWKRAGQMPPREPVQEGVPMPPVNYSDDVSAND